MKNKPIFNIRDKVKIVELNCMGRILSIWIGEVGTKYEVRYFWNSDPKTSYFFFDELEKINEEKEHIDMNGFKYHNK